MYIFANKNRYSKEIEVRKNGFDDHKVCPKCNELKHNGCFNKSTNSSDGLQFWCKDCKRNNRKNNNNYKKMNEKYESNYNKLCYSINKLLRVFVNPEKIENLYCHIINLVMKNCNCNLIDAEYFFYRFKNSYCKKTTFYTNKYFDIIAKMKKIKMKKCNGDICNGLLIPITEFKNDKQTCERCCDKKYSSKKTNNDGNDVFYQDEFDFKKIEIKESRTQRIKINPEICETCINWIKDKLVADGNKGLCREQFTNPFATKLYEKGLKPVMILYFDKDFGCIKYKAIK